MTSATPNRGARSKEMASTKAPEIEAAAFRGLTSNEAALRLAADGPNVIDTKIRQSLIARIGRRLAEPLTAILLLSALISGASGDWQSFGIIVVIVGISVVLDVVQEHKASLAIEALSQEVAVRAKVIRDKQLIIVPVREVVRGDVVELEGGDLVPADGIVLASRAALANEASLTGEPYPVEKNPARDPLSKGVTDAAAFYVQERVWSAARQRCW